MHTKRNICAIIKGGTSLEGTPRKLVDKFTYLGSSIESTEEDIDTRLTKAWTAINRLSIIWKSDLTDKMKRSFFQAAVTLILLYGCTTWTLTKRPEKKLDGNYIYIYIYIYEIWYGLVLWYINPNGLVKAIPSLYIYAKYKKFD